ncbi:MAG: winged helix-turn-helix domain-containing protein, partial [Coprococcus sp.]
RYDTLGSIREDRSDEQLTVGDITLDIVQKKLYVRGGPVKMTATEFKILQLMMTYPGRVFPAEEIYERVWENDAYAVENTIMIHISRIREKIELNPRKPEYLKVIWGIGYVFEKP